MVTEMAGKVYFVGAGPGDPGLLTIKSLELMRSADVIIYDSLVTTDILREIPDNVRKIAVRKTPRAHGLGLQEMCSLMIAFAKSGEKVIRLKSGDPLIFGRTWEEIEFLRSEGVTYEIVPGITSALSSAAFAEIPLTDRRFSSSFAIVTGHEANAKKSHSVNWEGLAKSVDTIVVLMGVSTISDYCSRLHDSGVEDEAAVTVIANASRQGQKILRSTIGEIRKGIPDGYGDLCTVIISTGKAMCIPKLENPVEAYSGVRR